MSCGLGEDIWYELTRLDFALGIWVNSVRHPWSFGPSAPEALHGSENNSNTLYNSIDGASETGHDGPL